MTERHDRPLRLALAAALGLCLALIVAPADSRGDDQADVRAAFFNTGADPDASGYVQLRIRSNRASVKIVGRDLDPHETYELRMNDVTHASLQANRGGRARERFDLFPEDGGDPALYADPRGQLLSLVGPNGTAVLSVVLSGVLEPADIDLDETVQLHRRASAPADATGEVRYRTKKGRSRLDLKADDLDSSEVYRLRVGGEVRATLEPRGRNGRVRLRLDDRDGSLGFDPRGEVVQVVDSRNRVVLSDELRAEIPGKGTAQPPGGPVPVEFRVRLPGFVDNPAVALRLWRREPGQSGWELATMIFLWPADPGSRTISYSYVDPATGGVDASSETEVAAQWRGDGSLTFPLHYVRSGQEALFKVSALNTIGESPRSRDAVVR